MRLQYPPETDYPTVDDTLREELKTGVAVAVVLRQFPTMTSGNSIIRLVKKFIPCST